MDREVSTLERERAGYRPRLPALFEGGIGRVGVAEEQATAARGDEAAIRGRFPRTFGQPLLRLVPVEAEGDAEPLRVGVVLSGGQAPGGHNVITGLHDALQGARPGALLYGFLGGSKGILEGRHRELGGATVDPYRNTGGFDMIGSGRDKIETEAQLAASRTTCEGLRLDGLVVIGGDDSNTNAAVLAEYFIEHGVSTCVVGVPKTIDGDLKGDQVEISFGFDTATKVYSELIGNICRDAKSAGKYWHFIKLMGRNASHVTLECALRTRPNVALIGEEIQARGLTLEDVVDRLAEAIRHRAEAGKRHGVCLVPEGLIEFIPEIRGLIRELNALLSERAGEPGVPGDLDAQRRFILGGLSAAGGAVFGALPPGIQDQLLLDRDAHGNVQVSKIDTEALLTEKVQQRLAEWSAEGRFRGKFQVQRHFFGYEGRCAAPSNFDADYTFSLGHVAAALIARRRTGYICSLRGLSGPAEGWSAAGVPLVSMMQVETRKGQPTPVIAKALVELDGEPFRAFAAARETWEREDAYRFPGPIQYFGPAEIRDQRTATLLLEHGKAAGSA